MSESEEEGIDLGNEGAAPNEGKKGKRNRKKKDKKRAKKAGDWDCPSCGADNFASRTECFKCNAPKPEAGEEIIDKGGGKGEEKSDKGGGDVRPGDWGCPRCGANNFASRIECFKCGAPKPGGSERNHDRGGRREEPPPRPGDWGCPSCGANNFANRTECFKCGVPKPGGDRGAGLHRPGVRVPPWQMSRVGGAPSPQADSFHRFATATRLPPDALCDWEHDLRQQLLEILGHLRGPLPLVEWINHRIGGEVETFQDDMGAVNIRLRSQNVYASAPPAGGAPLRGERGPPAENDAAKAEKRSMNFFEKLPGDSFNPSEVKLRNAILEFLASWTSTEKATLPDLANDEVIDKMKQQFVPRVVPLEEWIQRRMGEEVLFRADRFGKELVELTQIGLEAVQEKIDELAAGKRKSENDIHPTGGKRQRVRGPSGRGRA